MNVVLSHPRSDNAFNIPIFKMGLEKCNNPNVF